MSSPAPSRSALRSTLLVGAATFASRLLGLVREQLFAALLGAGVFADAFVVAFRIPNMLRDLFAEGALSAAFVPTFAKVEKEHGPEAAHRLADRVVGAICLTVGAVVVAAIVFAEPLVSLLAPGFEQQQGKLELTVALARLMMPFLLLVSLGAVAMGMLNARGRFSTPALAPALFNLAAIAVGIGLAIGGAPPAVAVFGWSLGTLLGGLAQLGVQLPPLWRGGWRPRPVLWGFWQDPGVRRIARLMAPAALGLAAVEANIVVNTWIASREAGANAWLNYAFRLMYLPIGIFGVAIATVTASGLARRAAEKDLEGLEAALTQGLRHVGLLTVPSMVGLWVLAEPIVALLYQHGRFDAADTRQTAAALAFYSVGLYAYSAVKVVAPAFYALDRARVPLIGSAAAVATNLTLNLIAYRWLGYRGLALGVALGAWANLAILLLAFRAATRTPGESGGATTQSPGESGGPPRPEGDGGALRTGAGRVPGQRLLGQFVRVVAASALMGLCVVVAEAGIRLGLARAGVDAASLGSRLVLVMGGVGVGAVVYGLACRLLAVEEAEQLLAALRRRARRA